jgi:dTDP-D-glucose 4,6-dehydratase
MNIEVAQELGWSPTTKMADAIAKTYDWYIDSMRGEN